MRVWQTVLLVFWAWGVIILLTRGSDLETLPFPDMSWGPQISILSEMLKAEGSVLMAKQTEYKQNIVIGPVVDFLFIYLTIFGKYFRAFRKVVRIRMMQRKSIYPSLRLTSLSPLHPHIYVGTRVCLHMYTHIFLKLFESKLVMLCDSLLIICQVHFISKCSVIVSSGDTTILDIGVIFPPTIYG